MKRHLILALALSLAGFGQASAEDTGKPAIAVARVTTSIQEGAAWGNVKYGLLCTAVYEKLNWGSGAGKINVRGFESPVRSELKQEGFAIAGDPSDPFATDKTADLAIGATITALHGNFCALQHVFDRTAWDGTASIEVDWQIYSNIERRSLAKVHTSGEAKLTGAKEGYQLLLFAALDESLRKFTASDEFKQAVQTKAGGPRSSTAPPAFSAPKTAINLPGSSHAQPMKIADAVGSVVLVLSGGGHGSGFLISKDGYVMTAEHVVGSDKYVKIRWSDGLDGVGEVIRSDKRRDVAIIKTDPRNRQPLALRREAPQPGDTVFAIGAPIDPKLQNTVTRGVVSASNRIMDGFSFIQSDVTVDPGNSGGPLLDEQGRVLGFTDKGIRTAEAPTGLNFFVPIDDALRFLSAEPQ